jgi:hypothetical protein
MSGTFESLSGTVINFADGTSHSTAPKCTVTLNGKAAKLDDLQKGDTVSLSGNPATSVAATR